MTDAGLDSSPGPNDAGVDVATGGSLTLALDPTLDEPDDDAGVTTLVSGALLDVTGAKVATGSITNGGLVFDLASVKTRDHFILVNGIADRLVPTRIDDRSTTIVQRVSRQLRASYVGPPESARYRIRTFPEDPVVQFTDEALVKDESAYALITFAPSSVEFLVLGSAAPLTSLALHGCIGHPDVRSDAWLLNTSGKDHHGDTFKADGGSENCGGCHTDFWMKKPSYAVITPSRGWCFRCHDGIAGSGAGFIDPLR